MNAEARAKELAARFFDFLSASGSSVSASQQDSLESIVASALRQAENDKLEEAARELDLSLLANIEDAPKDWLVGFDYARDRVLSLKSKD